AASGGAVAGGGLGAPARGRGEGAAGARHARALIRAQLRTALSTCGIALAVIAGLPLLPLAVPDLSRVRPWGVPLAWMIVAAAAQAAWIALAARHVRRSERNERELAAFVDLP
ncbi:hypothetical protein, partial [Actinomadura viridis]|uniref:hypothetical protein n=1 Tax=Actinomadura viridis TaxID=58110 RepID=UPI0031EBE447